MQGVLMVNTNPNPDQIFLVDGGQKTLIPPGGSGGITQSQMITGLKNCGVVDQRTTLNGNDQICALQAIPWHPNSPTS